MSIKVTFPNNQRIVTQNGLYQWDYGQELEIESDELGSEIVEVHFASQNMSEAIVRSCSFVNGVGVVTVPDLCLEQASPVTAWVYLIDGTTGHTWGTINLPINKRTKPSMSREIPQEVSDRYTELITEVNRTVGALESGDVKAANAENAAKADFATSAGVASNATYATSAGRANEANNADKANSDEYGNRIATTYLKTNEEEYEVWDNENVKPGGVVSFRVTSGGDTASLIVDMCNKGVSPQFVLLANPYFLRFEKNNLGQYTIALKSAVNGVEDDASINYTIRYKYLSTSYTVG